MYMIICLIKYCYIIFNQGPKKERGAVRALILCGPWALSGNRMFVSAAVRMERWAEL